MKPMIDIIKKNYILTAGLEPAATGLKGLRSTN